MVTGLRRLLLRSRYKARGFIDEAAEYHNTTRAKLSNDELDAFIAYKVGDDATDAARGGFSFPTKPLLGAGALGLGGYWLGTSTEGDGTNDDGSLALREIVTEMSPLQLGATAVILGYLLLQYGPTLVRDIDQANPLGTLGL